MRAIVLAVLLATVLLAAPGAFPAAARGPAPGGADAAAGSGGARSSLGETGGARYDPAARRRRARRAARGRRTRRRSRPVLASFALAGKRVFRFGRPARVAFRIDARARLADVRLYLAPMGSRRPATALRLRRRPRGTLQRVALGARELGALADGAYSVWVGAKDAHGRRLRRRAGLAAPLRLSLHSHRFPLVGRFSFGGPGSRFGAGRRGHRHQGQDLAAAEGTPVVAPRGGLIEAVQYQASGAGHYVVLDGAGEDRDYVFMHLRTGSISVRAGEAVRTGERLGEVGTTGTSSGPHLHFEVWVGGGWYQGGHPIDPLPLLRAWPR